MAKKFLIADDSLGKMDFLRAYVEHSDLDVEILEAQTTEHAIDLINEHPDIAYAFVDFEIPSAGGPAIIEALRSANPNAKIALCTSGHVDYYWQPAKEAGADAFVCTSETSDIVERTLRELLEEWKKGDRG